MNNEILSPFCVCKILLVGPLAKTLYDLFTGKKKKISVFPGEQPGEIFFDNAAGTSLNFISNFISQSNHV